MSKAKLLKELGWSNELIAEFEKMAKPIHETNHGIKSIVNATDLSQSLTSSSIYIDNNNTSSQAYFSKDK
jgi:hypothetical protein